MKAEIAGLMSSKAELQKQNDFLMSNLMKLISEFEQRNIIRIQKTETHNLYFYLNSKDQAEVVAKVPKAEVIEQHFRQEMGKAWDRELQESQKLEKHNVRGLDNELCSFWERKKIYLDIDDIVKTYFHWNV